MEDTWVNIIEAFLVVFALGAVVNIVWGVLYVFGRVPTFGVVNFWKRMPRPLAAILILVFIPVTAYLLFSFHQDLASRGVFLFGIGNDGGQEGAFPLFFFADPLYNYLWPLIGGAG